MGDYDLQIMVVVVITCILFGSFMYLFEQEPHIKYTSTTDAKKNWSEPQDATEIENTFDLFKVFNKRKANEIFLVKIFISCMGIIGVIIVARYLRGQ